MAMLLEDLNSILKHGKALSIEQDQNVQKCVAPIVLSAPLDRLEEPHTGWQRDEDCFGRPRLLAA
ncbi:hypothetical protein ASD12_32250 [Mesorhizobium sp. Root102]|uniref:hypothetical protein n=1 Tax=Mesorhizobium sp. Root102 TaxID=1736422 RepID=UPI000700BE50|nr:hypothetical protein [Mesorhizobium sp. Root102]KQU82256.1 hypothetical protein ASD12_32250 [Mesorhizobium sp. Root102]